MTNQKIITMVKSGLQLSQMKKAWMFQSDIPKVSIVFFSTNEEILNEVISAFRKKTIRAGG
ncbi:hypothetical protein KHA80_02165 [Anaerobacillus sp. HL2]|nr:hypothetical protein KHA80_02165 [Anaerobacillus sp. HL2]